MRWQKFGKSVDARRFLENEDLRKKSASEILQEAAKRGITDSPELITYIKNRRAMAEQEAMDRSQNIGAGVIDPARQQASQAGQRPAQKQARKAPSLSIEDDKAYQSALEGQPEFAGRMRERGELAEQKEQKAPLLSPQKKQVTPKEVTSQERVGKSPEQSPMFPELKTPGGDLRYMGAGAYSEKQEADQQAKDQSFAAEILSMPTGEFSEKGAQNLRQVAEQMGADFTSKPVQEAVTNQIANRAARIIVEDSTGKFADYENPFDAINKAVKEAGFKPTTQMMSKIRDIMDIFKDQTDLLTAKANSFAKSIGAETGYMEQLLKAAKQKLDTQKYSDKRLIDYFDLAEKYLTSGASKTGGLGISGQAEIPELLEMGNAILTSAEDLAKEDPKMQTLLTEISKIQSELAKREGMQPGFKQASQLGYSAGGSASGMVPKRNRKKKNLDDYVTK